jgi:hypothetical protein
MDMNVFLYEVTQYCTAEDYELNKSKLKSVSIRNLESILECLKLHGQILPAIKMGEWVDNLASTTHLTPQEIILLIPQFDSIITYRNMLMSKD